MRMTVDSSPKKVPVENSVDATARDCPAPTTCLNESSVRREDQKDSSLQGTKKVPASRLISKKNFGVKRGLATALGAISVLKPVLAGPSDFGGGFPMLRRPQICRWETVSVMTYANVFEPGPFGEPSACEQPVLRALAAQQCAAAAALRGASRVSSALPLTTSNTIRQGPLGVVTCLYMCSFEVCS